MPRKTDFIGYDNVCIEFLTSQKKGTQRTYKAFLKHILKFTGMTGQQILDSKKADKNYEWEKKVITFKQWMKNQKTPQGKNYSDNAVNTTVNTLRSFFDYYRTKLDFSQNENRKLNGKAKRVTQDYMLTNETISKMVLVADLREKYIVLLGKSFGLRAGDFITLTYGRFRSINLEQEPPIFIGEFQTEKEGVTAYPFIDSDALPIIKAVLDGNKNKPDHERIITVQNEELSSILQALAVKADINLGNQHLRFHCFRKYLITRLSGNMSESKWKQIIGKAVPEEAYVNDFELRENYLKTMKLTTINTNGNGKVSKLSEQVTALSKLVSEKSQELEEQSQEIEELRNIVKKETLEVKQSLSELKENWNDENNRIRQRFEDMGGNMWYISQFAEEFNNAEKLQSLFELWKKVEDKQIDGYKKAWESKTKLPEKTEVDVYDELTKTLTRLMKPLEEEKSQSAKKKEPSSKTGKTITK